MENELNATKERLAFVSKELEESTSSYKALQNEAEQKQKLLNELQQMNNELSEQNSANLATLSKEM